MKPLDDKLPLLFLLLALAAVAISLINSSRGNNDNFDERTFEQNVVANGPSARGSGGRSARVKRALTTKKPGAESADPWRVFGWHIGCGHAPLFNYDYSYSNPSYENLTAGEFPSYVRLRAGRNLTLCGATLISNRHILTAGRCLEKIRHIDPIIVTFGKYQLLNKGEEEVELNFTMGANVGQHYCYNAMHYHSPQDQKVQDYALLKLPYAVKLNEYIQPACLPLNDRYTAITQGRDEPVCWVIGVVASIEFPIRLDKIRVTQTSCGKGVKYFDDPNWESRVCYKKWKGAQDTVGRKLSCQDTSWAGGPVLCKNKGSSWTVMGTASYVLNKVDCLDKVSASSLADEDDQLIYTDIPKSLKLFNKSCRDLLE